MPWPMTSRGNLAQLTWPPEFNALLVQDWPSLSGTSRISVGEMRVGAEARIFMRMGTNASLMCVIRATLPPKIPKAGKIDYCKTAIRPHRSMPWGFFTDDCFCVGGFLHLTA